MPYLPPELLVFFTSMLPIVELRGAIPLGLLLHLPIEGAFFWAEIGNMIPIFFILKLLGPVSDFLIKHSKFFEKFFHKLFTLTREKHGHKMQKWGAASILILTSIPLPGTGAWTGALLAFLFDIPFWKAVILILIGNLIAGLLICFGFGSAIEVAKLFVK